MLALLTTVTPPLPRGSYLAPPLLFTQTYLSRFTLPAANLKLLLLGSYLPPAGILPRQEN